MTKYSNKKTLVCAITLLPDKSSEMEELMFLILNFRSCRRYPGGLWLWTCCSWHSKAPQVDVTDCLFHCRKAMRTYMSRSLKLDLYLSLWMISCLENGCTITYCQLFALFLQIMLFLLMKMFYYPLFSTRHKKDKKEKRRGSVCCSNRLSWPYLDYRRNPITTY